jgi:hypothetical protein
MIPTSLKLNIVLNTEHYREKEIFPLIWTCFIYIYICLNDFWKYSILPASNSLWSHQLSLFFSHSRVNFVCFTSYMCHTHKICTCFGNLCAACHEHWFRSKTIAYIMLEIKAILNITTMVVDLRFHKWKQCPSQILWIFEFSWHIHLFLLLKFDVINFKE